MASRLSNQFIRILFLLVATAGISLPALAAQVALNNATATFCQVSFSIANSIDASFTNDVGWAIHPQEGNDQTAVYKTASDISHSADTELTFDLHMLHSNGGHLLGKFRLAATTSNRGTYGQGSECSDANPGGSASWSVLHPESAVSANGQSLTINPDGSILAGGSLPATDVVTVRVSSLLQGTTGFRLEVFADESLPYGGPGRYTTNGNFVLTELVVNEQGNNAHVPTLGAWGLALMALLLSMAGIFRLRRNRVD